MIAGFTKIRKCKGLQKSFKSLWIAGRCNSTLFGVIDDNVTNRSKLIIENEID